MTSIIDRATQVINSLDDLHYTNDLSKYYVNKSLLKVVSYMIRKEEAGINLNALDALRKVSTKTINSASKEGEHWKVQIEQPSDSLKIENLLYNSSISLDQKSPECIPNLDLFNEPNKHEGYYVKTVDGNQQVFDLYLYEDPTGKDIKTFYIEKPQEVKVEDTDFSDFPERLENAVIYGAAVMMASQELNEGVKAYQSIYQEELQLNTF